jgi:hypothetical protein
VATQGKANHKGVLKMSTRAIEADRLKVLEKLAELV